MAAFAGPLIIRFPPSLAFFLHFQVERERKRISCAHEQAKMILLLSARARSLLPIFLPFPSVCQSALFLSLLANVASSSPLFSQWGNVCGNAGQAGMTDGTVLSSFSSLHAQNVSWDREREREKRNALSDDIVGWTELRI